MNQNAHNMLQAYEDVLEMGLEIAPHGNKCKELCDYWIDLDLSIDDGLCTSFAARNFNLNYAKQEFMWYLRADKYDNTIEQHAKLWAKIKQPQGYYFSNYGQYIFNEQFKWVVNCLADDPYSRQASIVLLNAKKHLFHGNKDVVCTYAINFRIRTDELHMTVMMRSNDLIWGFTNDSFCFIMLYKMVLAMLKERYPNLQPGMYRHIANSLHIYERHYEMANRIVAEGIDGYRPIQLPTPTVEEVKRILLEPIGHPSRSAPQGPMTEWLNEQTLSSPGA